MTNFKNIIQKYASEGVVFQSTGRGKSAKAYYSIKELHAANFIIERLSSNQDQPCSYSSLQKKLTQIQNAGGSLLSTDVSGTTATRMALVQSTELGLAADYQTIVDLSKDDVALEHFQQCLTTLRVNSSGDERKLYKPVVLWCVIDAVRSGELTENCIMFDWLEPRFLQKLKELNVSASATNLAETFFHLTNDLLWMLAYDDTALFLTETPTVSLLKERVRHAILNDSYWRLLSSEANCQNLLKRLEKHWWTMSDNTKLKINLDLLDLAVKKMIKPYLIDEGELLEGGDEASHREKILSKATPHLTKENLLSDPVESLLTAVKFNAGLLFQFDVSALKNFIQSEDAQEISGRTIDLLYGLDSLEERCRRFQEWSHVIKMEDGKKKGINNLVISYLLAASQPKTYAFCKPKNAYTPAVKALLGEEEVRTDAVKRIVHTKQFYEQVLKLFQERYQLPFTDLFHVHAVFYRLNDPPDNYPGWKQLLSQETNGTSPMPTPKSTHPLNTILYGPPGTGKTYDTMRRAVEICDGVASENRGELATRYNMLREENRIDFVTFHQSYGYEEFIEGIRPVLKTDGEEDFEESNGDVQYECRPGVLKKLCTLAKTPRSQLSPKQEIDLENITIWKMSLGNARKPEDDIIYDTCLDDNFLLIGYGNEIDFTECHSRKEIFLKLQEEHPEVTSTDYTIQAVDAFKNKMQQGDLVVISDGKKDFRAIARVTGDYQFSGEESATRYQQMRPVEWLVIYEESLPGDIIYTKSFSQRTIYELNKKYLKLDSLRERVVRTSDSPKNHVLIIDEINRGNVSKILGELITLLEPDKRLGAANELQVSLPYSGQSFGVPSNVYVIGTMNTADRSIAILDVALRRRFQFVEMMPDTKLIRSLVGEKGMVDDVDVALLLETINDRIELLYDRDHQIGHSFFLNVDSLISLRDVMCQKIIPLLQEYFYGDWEKVCMVLGCPIHEETKRNDKSNSHPLIHSRPLESKSLLSSNTDFIEDKVRCEIHPVFATSEKTSELKPVVYWNHPENRRVTCRSLLFLNMESYHAISFQNVTSLRCSDLMNNKHKKVVTRYLNGDFSKISKQRVMSV